MSLKHVFPFLSALLLKYAKFYNEIVNKSLTTPLECLACDIYNGRVRLINFIRPLNEKQGKIFNFIYQCEILQETVDEICHSLC